MAEPAEQQNEKHTEVETKDKSDDVIDESPAIVGRSEKRAMLVDPVDKKPCNAWNHNKCLSKFQFYGVISQLLTDKMEVERVVLKMVENVQSQEIFKRGIKVLVPPNKTKSTFLQVEVPFNKGVPLVDQAIAVTCTKPSHCAEFSLEVISLAGSCLILYVFYIQYY